jgi:hypothetical protein
MSYFSALSLYFSKDPFILAKYRFSSGEAYYFVPKVKKQKNKKLNKIN